MNVKQLPAEPEEIGERVKTAEHLERQARRLTDQVRNLRCLHEISVLREEMGVDGWQDYLHAIAGLLPAAWQFPESTCARITVNGEIFTTKQFSETAWRMESPVKVHGAQAGKVEVFYREERPPADEGPFTAEERRLIDIVAERVGRIIEHLQARQALEAARADLERRVKEPTAPPGGAAIEAGAAELARYRPAHDRIQTWSVRAIPGRRRAGTPPAAA